MGKRRRRWATSRTGSLCLAICLAISSCGGSLPTGNTNSSTTPDATDTSASTPPPAPAETPNDAPAAPTTAPTPEPTSEPKTATAEPATDGQILVSIDTEDDGVPIDPRLFGTNLPAWLGSERFNDPDFQQRAIESGTTLVRMPGGSWSNGYDWLGCEHADEETCKWTWAARPTDFIDFMQATELQGMWTVSVNDTAQQSAAAVAFFNGDVDDTTQIGVDRLGVDWGEVGDWAQLRATNGNPDPIDILLWEVGNEVYGSRPEAGGTQCAAWGWEDVWTCDGTEYAEGTSQYDGALAHRTAMMAVDPTIEVGLVGVGDPTSWNDWGNEVINAAGQSLDLYVVHDYGFNRSPTPLLALSDPRVSWPTVITDARQRLPEGATLAITEYNLVAVETQDTAQTMTRAMNAFYLAETLGEFAIAEVAVANWWNLANGTAENGTDYGLFNVDDDQYEPAPTFQAFAMWARTGATLLPPTRLNEFRVYPTQHPNGNLVVLVVNLSSEPTDTRFTVEDLDTSVNYETTFETLTTDDLESQEQLIAAVPVELASPHEPIDVTVPAYSLSLIEIRATG